MADEASRIIKLSRPVPLADGTLIGELSFREPRVVDIAKVGNPVKFDITKEEPDISFDDAKMMAMAALLSGQPATIIGAVRVEDWISICWAVAGFFFPSAEAKTSSV